MEVPRPFHVLTVWGGEGRLGVDDIKGERLFLLVHAISVTEKPQGSSRPGKGGRVGESNGERKKKLTEQVRVQRELEKRGTDSTFKALLEVEACRQRGGAKEKGKSSP